MTALALPVTTVKRVRTLKLLLKDVRFSTKPEEGLEFVDILSNAIRRTLTGKLQKVGWKNIHRLMVHRNEPYLEFILLGDREDVVKHVTYEKVVNEGFSSQGKSMLTPSNSRWAVDEIAKDNASLLRWPPKTFSGPVSRLRSHLQINRGD